MVKSLFKDIFQSIFGFLIVLVKLLKKPLKMYEVAGSSNGFRLGLSTIIWILIFDIWVGKTLLNHANDYEFSSNENVETLIDYGDNEKRVDNSSTGKVLNFVSTPILKELTVFTRLFISLILIIPIALLLLGKRKNEKDFRSFISLNFMLSSFAALLIIILTAITFNIFLIRGDFELLNMFSLIQSIITLIIGIPMLIIVYKNWRGMLPNIKKGRMIFSYLIWLLGGALISGGFKAIINNYL